MDGMEFKAVFVPNMVGGEVVKNNRVFSHAVECCPLALSTLSSAKTKPWSPSSVARRSVQIHHGRHSVQLVHSNGILCHLHSKLSKLPNRGCHLLHLVIDEGCPIQMNHQIFRRDYGRASHLRFCFSQTNAAVEIMQSL